MSKANSNPAQRLSAKEPWLAVNLSMFFPGLGQTYSRQLIRGLLIAVIYLVLILYGGGVLISSTGNIELGLICLFLTFPVNIFNLFDAHRCARTLNPPSFETLRKTQKDPWLAVFLSRLIPGIGHLYIGKKFVGFFLVVISLIIPFIDIIILPFVAYNAYGGSATRRENSNLPITLISLAIVISLLINLAFSLGVKTFIAEARYIPSGSMLPTLQINDRLVIDKLGYYFHTPQRGDIIVFSPTDELRRQNFKDAFIKRLIGLPGETIEVKDGKVYINGQTLLESYIQEAPTYEWGSVTVPPNSYAVLGDNRNNAYDSHYWGFVPRENIIGKATKRFWPLDRLANVLSAPPGGISSTETPSSQHQDPK